MSRRRIHPWEAPQMVRAAALLLAEAGTGTWVSCAAFRRRWLRHYPRHDSYTPNGTYRLTHKTNDGLSALRRHGMISRLDDDIVLRDRQRLIDVATHIDRVEEGTYQIAQSTRVRPPCSSGKKQFDRRRDAERALLRMWRNSNGTRSEATSYHCPWCGYYHNTSRSSGDPGIAS